MGGKREGGWEGGGRERKRGGKGNSRSRSSTRTQKHAHATRDEYTRQDKETVMIKPGETEKMRVNRRGEPPGKWKKKEMRKEEGGKMCRERKMMEGN